MTTARDLDDLVSRQHVVICCGTGGVGKTTTAAALAVEGARRGRRTAVITIDPARRLADTLGLSSSTDDHEVARALWDPDGDAPAGGRLTAFMLDTGSTFDGLVVSMPTVTAYQYFRNKAARIAIDFGGIAEDLIERFRAS